MPVNPDSARDSGYFIYLVTVELGYKHQGDKAATWATEDFLLDLIENYVPHGDAAAVKKSLRKNEGWLEVKEDLAITKINGIDRVPTFLVNGQRYSNPKLIELANEIDSVITTVD